ncbi:MAG TPA: NAD-binding protein [Gaiellaceae bacterium]|nr:NAD-binding protein [Gaiellaceae bacterium]
MSTAVAIVALPAASAVIWALLRSPATSRLIAVPSADRWHETQTPSFGGIGIFVGFSTGLWGAAAVGAYEPSEAFVGIYGAVALVFAAGLADDLYGLGPIAKLAAQGGAAAIVLATGTHVQLVHSAVIGDAIAVLWLIGISNAFNLLDNMDGLAASLAAIAFGFFAVDAVTAHPDDAALAFALAGALACLGFLPFNLRPGKPALVFMGDSGSQALGFALAALGLSSSWRVAGSTVATLVLPVLVLAVPILDTALVTVARLLDGRPIYEGARDHSSHRLVRFGLSERHTVALLALISLCIGGSSLAYTVLDNFEDTILGVFLTFVLLVQFASFLADIDRRPEIGEPLGLAQAFAVHWRRLVEVIVDFIVITASYLAAYVIVFGWPGTIDERTIRDHALPVILAARYLAFIPFGLYRSVWRYAGFRDVTAAAAAVIVSELAALSFVVLTLDLGGFHRSFFIIDALICMVAIAGSRLAERTIVIGKRSAREGAARRTVIVGAGKTGLSLMRELRETAGERVVGFVDDNPQLRRRRISGVKVIGTTEGLARTLEQAHADIVLVTIPNAPRETLETVVDACAKAGVTCRFVRREIDLDPRVVFGAASE